MRKGILQSELFYCDHLGASARDESDVKCFSVRDEKGFGLQEYIQRVAFSEEDAGIMRTYLVRDIRSSELVGYFSLKAGLISLNETEEERRDDETGIKETVSVFDTLPGVELANFAVNYSYIQAHPDLKGVGLVIFESFILPVIRKTSENIGMKILYIFSLPFDELISRYEQYGFSRLNSPYQEELHKRLKPRYDASCMFMFQIL